MFSCTAAQIWLCMRRSLIVWRSRVPRMFMSDLILPSMRAQKRSNFPSSAVSSIRWQASISCRCCRGFSQFCFLWRTRELQRISAQQTSEEVGEKSFRTSPWLAAAQAISALNRPEAMESRSSTRISPYFTAIYLELMKSMRLYRADTRSWTRSLPTRARSRRRGNFLASMRSTRCVKLKCSLSRESRVRKGRCVPRMTWKMLMLPCRAAKKFSSFIAKMSSRVVSRTPSFAFSRLAGDSGDLSCDSEIVFSILAPKLLQEAFRRSGEVSLRKEVCVSSLTALTIVSLVSCTPFRSQVGFPLCLFLCSSSKTSSGQGPQFCSKEKGLRWNLAKKFQSLLRFSSSRRTFSSNLSFSSMRRFLEGVRKGRLMPQYRDTPLISCICTYLREAARPRVAGTSQGESAAKWWVTDVSSGDFLNDVIQSNRRNLHHLSTAPKCHLLSNTHHKSSLNYPIIRRSVCSESLCSYLNSTEMNLFEEAWRNIISPPQIRCKMAALGPRERLVGEQAVVRVDFAVLNRNGKRLEGFLFHAPQAEAAETILYLHGNGGSKLEALPLAELVPQFGCNLAAFDLLGCGNSEAGQLSYGVNEVFDIRDVLEEVRRHVRVARVTLWGRSMGSLCALMFANAYAYEVGALILDSPFRCLSGVVQRIAERKVQLPRLLLRPLLYLIEQRANDELGFDLFAIDYLSVLKKLNAHLPVLFIFSNFDHIVPAQEVLDFYNAYHGPKDLCEIYRTHDEDRPDDLFRQGLMWLTRSKRKNINAVMQAREQLLERKKEQRAQSQDSRLCSRNPENSCW